MAKTMKTPGVYIVQKSAFPGSVVEVATAVPAFIGYTEVAFDGLTSLLDTPRRITSMAEYHKYFGMGPPIEYTLTNEASAAPTGFVPSPAVAAQTEVAAESQDSSGNKTSYYLVRTSTEFNLYYSMMLFFQNGGGSCYIVSIGYYGSKVGSDPLVSGIELLIKEAEPTMIVVPDAVLIDTLSDCTNVQKAAMAQCVSMRSRVAVLDVYEGYKARNDGTRDCITDFRGSLGVNFLDYAAAYYPWIDTTIVQASELSYQLFDSDSIAHLQAILTDELGPVAKSPTLKQEQQLELIGRLDIKNWTPDELAESDVSVNRSLLNKSLIALSPTFSSLLAQILSRSNRLPPSGAMAGIYTMVDNSTGVWKAPANVSLNGVIKPTITISHDEQEDLNVTPQGKSINAIRPFIGEGTLVWRARTLDGNSMDWRYISVRRTMIMLEQSIKLASKAYVFDANDANTWVTMKAMFRNFLTGIWKRGGLAGAVPDDAFSVHIELGETMTGEDILEGILRVTIVVAVTRPAEFIEFTFQQQMRKF